MDLAQKFKELQDKNEEFEALGRDGKVLVIDGLNTYIRCFASTPTMNDDGDHIGGVVGFLKSVGLAIRQIRPTRVIIAFDGRGGSQKRRQIFANYKDNRKSMTRLNRTYNFNTIEDEQQSMKRQMFLLLEILSNLPVTILAPDHIEADDTIAYVTNLVQERGGKVYIMSTDKDFLQLVNDNVKVYNPIKKKTYSVDQVLEEYSFHPVNFLIYRAMVGDKSDSIDGIKGVAEKTLLKHFSMLKESTEADFEQIFNIAETQLSTQKKPASLFKKIVDNKDIILRNKELMCLKTLDFSSNIKMKLLEQIDNDFPTVNKMGLTKELYAHKLLGSFGNLDDWIFKTWTPLNRYAKI
jgi:DNA polymerase-1